LIAQTFRFEPLHSGLRLGLLATSKVRLVVMSSVMTTMISYTGAKNEFPALVKECIIRDY
jgi:hypothetical protein